MWVTICTVVGPVRRTWAEIASAVRSEVSRKLATGGGAKAVISAILSSAMVRPDGIAATRPMASAPAAMAWRASSNDAMQQTLVRVLIADI